MTCCPLKSESFTGFRRLVRECECGCGGACLQCGHRRSSFVGMRERTLLHRKTQETPSLLVQWTCDRWHGAGESGPFLPPLVAQVPPHNRERDMTIQALNDAHVDPPVGDTGVSADDTYENRPDLRIAGCIRRTDQERWLIKDRQRFSNSERSPSPTPGAGTSAVRPRPGRARPRLRRAAPPADQGDEDAQGPAAGTSSDRRSPCARPPAHRELAVQVHERVAPWQDPRPTAPSPSTVVRHRPQVAKLHKGVDVVIATRVASSTSGPGEISVSRLETLVLDEADRMPTWVHAAGRWVLRVWRRPIRPSCSRPHSTAPSTAWSRRYLTEPVFHEVASSTRP